MAETMKPRVDDLPVGGKVWFAEEKRPYTVQARSKRFLVCTKPFALRRTVLYTIIDLKERIRGAENLVFGMGAETPQQCREMIDRLEGRRDLGFGATEVSHRNFVELDVVRVALPRAARAALPTAPPEDADGSR